MRILIVEDNRDITANLCSFLEPLGYAVEVLHNGAAGLARGCQGGLDAIVLDLGLPGLDGLDVCRQLRSEHRVSTPILMLTARDTVQDKVRGFEGGADDYLVKPFSMVELDVRLRSLVRRAAGTLAPAVLRFEDVALDLSRSWATRGEVTLRLTPTGYKLLAVLLREAPNLVPREALEREVWGDNPPDSDALRTHIHSLRMAIDKPFDKPLLKTLPGMGYMLATAHA